MMNAERKATGRSVSVGSRIQRLRKQRGLTAAELARRAELSKATMSSIESGNGNPTIETLDALAYALRIPLTDLLGGVGSDGTSLLPSVEADPNDVSRDLLQRIGAGFSTEIWRLRMPPRTEMNGVAHAIGTVEHLYVASGRLWAGREDEITEIGVGDMLSFAADAPHRYETREHPADVMVIMVSS